MSAPPVPRSALLALILAAACWGGGTVVSKRAVAEIPPLSLLVIQLAASLAFLAAAVLARPRAEPTTGVPPTLARLGLLNPGIGYALSLLGLVHISASLSVLLWAVEPLLIVLLAAVVLGEHVGRVVVGLSVAAVVGLGLVTGGPGEGGTLGGAALTLAGVACCAAYTVVARRWIESAGSTLRVVAAQQAWALALAVAVVGLLALTGTPPVPTAVSVEGWLGAIGSGVLYYGAAYWLYLSALRRLPASRAAASFYLVPIFGIAGGVLLLGERLGPVQWLGAGIVLASVTILVLRPAQRGPTGEFGVPNGRGAA